MTAPDFFSLTFEPSPKTYTEAEIQAATAAAVMEAAEAAKAYELRLETEAQKAEREGHDTAADLDREASRACSQLFVTIRALIRPDAMSALDAHTAREVAKALEGAGTGVYVASKAKYGPEWVKKRQSGYPIISTWIDESGVGATEDWPGLWTRCITEASSCAALVLICRAGDILKGAWAETGAALSNGIPVFATGVEEFSIRHHPGVTICDSEDEAFARAMIPQVKT